MQKKDDQRKIFAVNQLLPYRIPNNLHYQK